MTDQPQGVNLKFSSFAKKDGYKPPNATQLFAKKEQKRQRFAPGGDWGDDTEDQPAPVLSTNTKPANKGAPEPFEDIIDVAPKQDNTSSKFKFIKKTSKTEKTSTMDKNDSEQVLLDFDTVRSDK